MRSALLILAFAFSTVLSLEAKAMRPVTRKALQQSHEDPLHPDNFLRTPQGIGARSNPDAREYVILSDEELEDAILEAEEAATKKNKKNSSWIKKIWSKIRSSGWFGMKPSEERMRNIIRLE